MWTIFEYIVRTNQQRQPPRVGPHLSRKIAGLSFEFEHMLAAAVVVDPGARIIFSQGSGRQTVPGSAVLPLTSGSSSG